MDNAYLVGTVTSTHRLLGTVKISTNFYMLEEIVGKDVLLVKKDDIKLVKITGVKAFNGKKALVDFQNIKTLEQAKELVEYKIYIRKDLVEDYIEEETYIDYDVYENDENLGKVVDLMETAAHDILVVEDELSNEILIPFIDVFVEEIDDENKKIYVSLIEGMR